ncbi:hypothetical protein [Brevundimonas denitrificans]|uniref:hypothetical protein n=1 Tax=Brevundimonas denitrificans TaxID=1443434 RepID=UPI00223BACC8|nr:hypothetical protein [Brevundimonas denitrificans]
MTAGQALALEMEGPGRVQIQIELGRRHARAGPVLMEQGLHPGDARIQRPRVHPEWTKAGRRSASVGGSWPWSMVVSSRMAPSPPP